MYAVFILMVKVAADAECINMHTAAYNRYSQQMVGWFLRPRIMIMVKVAFVLIVGDRARLYTVCI